MGFVTEGLWAYSRHPNYFCEQAIWFAYYCFSLSSCKVWFNITIVGPLLLVTLFAASARFTEQVTSPNQPTACTNPSCTSCASLHTSDYLRTHIPPLPTPADRLLQVRPLLLLQQSRAHVPPLTQAVPLQLQQCSSPPSCKPLV